MAVQPEPKIDFIPAEEFVVDNLDTLKVLADPLRIQILDLMRDPCTVKQVAKELDIPPTKLYYHIKLLDEHGLIVLVDTRIVSGIIEKHYQTAAHTVRVQRQLLSPSPDSMDAGGLELTVSSLWQDVMQHLRESSLAGIIDTSGDDADVNPYTLNLRRANFVLTDEQAADFISRFRALVLEFRELSEKQFNDDSLQDYKLFTVMFPSARKRHPDSDE